MKHPFELFQLHGFLYEALKKLRITQPTEIQQKAIPVIMQGKDVIGQSQTGTGKTLAYLLPILQRIYTPRKQVQAIILAPSRELSTQIAANIEQLSKGSDIDVLLIQGGVDINRQIQRLKQNPHIVVGTPGRVLDLIKQNKLAAHTAKCLVIDEADTMLEMGFREDIEGIVQKMKRQMQYLLFSATLPPKVVNMAKTLMKQPCHFEINPTQVAAVGIEHVFFKVGSAGKDETLLRLLKLYNPYLAIVFVMKKEHVESVVTKLHLAGYTVEGLQGDLEQAKRKHVMKRFREAKTQILVATDLASRGLDVEGITHIFNYDLPINSDQYVHRTGRTGRAAETGLAVNLIKSDDEETKLRQIAHKLGQTFSEQAIVNDEIITKPTRAKKQPVATDQKANAAEKRAKPGAKTTKATDKYLKLTQQRAKTAGKDFKPAGKRARPADKKEGFTDKRAKAADKNESFTDKRARPTDKKEGFADKRARPADKKEGFADKRARPTDKKGFTDKRAKPTDKKASFSDKRARASDSQAKPVAKPKFVAKQTKPAAKPFAKWAKPAYPGAKKGR